MTYLKRNKFHCAIKYKDFNVKMEFCGHGFILNVLTMNSIRYTLPLVDSFRSKLSKKANFISVNILQT